MPTHSRRGFTQHYDLSGSGPELVWCHGLYMSSAKDEAFFGFLPELSSGHRFLTFDARGHGRSDGAGGPEAYTLDALAQDLEALLEEVGFTQPILVGGSMGSITALTYAALHPDRVKGLVLIQPTVIGADVKGVSRVSRTLSRVIERDGLEAASHLLVSMPAWAELARICPDRVEGLRQGVAAQNPESIRNASLGVVSPGGWDEQRLETLRTLDIPVLIIADPGDPSHPRSSAEQLFARLPRAELVMAPWTFYYFQHTEALLAHIQRFIQTVEAATT